MDFSLTEEQLRLREEVIAFAKREFRDPLVGADHSSTLNGEGWQKIAEAGILGAAYPEQYGGAGMDDVTAVVMLEALGYGCRDNGLTYAVNSQIWSVQLPLLKFGTDEQKDAWLPQLIRGEVVGAFAMTEPSSGSDAYSLRSTAERVDGGYVLNGGKSYITLGPICDVAIVFAKTAPDRGQWGISAFVVDSSTKGLRRPGATTKMGLRTAPIGEIVLDDCYVPEAALLGREGAGASIFNYVIEWERGLLLASQVGAMERQLDDTIAYVRSREQFGQSVGKFQSVSNRIADMRLRVELARMILYKVAWLKQTGQSASIESAMAKMYLSESFVESSISAIRNHGAVGYLTDFEVERELRDGIGGLLYSGTTDIQRVIVARLLGL